MRKIFNIVFIICLVASATIFTTACDLKHSHTYSDNWSYDSYYHWRESTCGHNIEAYKSGHVFELKNAVAPSKNRLGYEEYECEVCGHKKRTNYTCLVTYSYLDENGQSVIFDSNILPTYSLVVEKGSTLPAIIEEDLTTSDSQVEYQILGYKNADTNESLAPNLSHIYTSTNVNVILSVKEKIDTSALNDLIDRINSLEQIAIQYYNSDIDTARHQVLSYLRAIRYPDEPWAIFCYPLDSGFKSVVESSGWTLTPNGNTGTFFDPFTCYYDEQDQKVDTSLDLIHMFAVLNMFDSGDINNSYTRTVMGFPITISWTPQDEQDLSGWGGDMVQLVKQVIDGGNLSELFASHGSNSSFGADDLIADIDAANIYAIYANMSSPSISEAIRTYYLDCNSKNRESIYLSIVFANELAELDSQRDVHSQLQQKLYTRLNNNNAIKAYCFKTYNNMNFVSSNSNTFNACIDLFLTYLGL